MAFGGAQVKRLVQAIDAAFRHGRFDHKPIGPIGSLLSLTDDRWALAVEAAIGGGSFNGFIVSSDKDLEVFKASHLGIHSLSCVAMKAT